MDRPIESKERRREILGRILVAVATITVGVLLFFAITGWIRPSVRRSQIRTAVVERGPVDETVVASGTVVPAYEHVITSPIESRVLKIHLKPGARVAAGEPVIGLDVSETEASLAKLDDEIALNENQRDEAHLEGERERAALLTRREIKALELKSAEYEAERNRKFFEKGGLFSRDEVRKSENDAEKARLELRQIDEELANQEDTLKKTLRGIELELAISVRQRQEAARRLERATASSDREGVLTWVPASEGVAVHRGDELARVADLSAFRVEASISDVHASRVAVGQAAIVRSGDHRMNGRVANVLPTVENGIVTLEIDLDDPSAQVLRHNLRVDVHVVTDRRDQTLRVKRGSFLTTEGTHAAFVIHGDKALRTPVRFGLRNIDWYEILEGIEEGDELIISDMNDKMHVEEVQLR